ncbi:hypothetical protein CONCODRAFT_5273 [Conidiobolus coronatus NRRL 28638]|uniref:Uncharacterized protein n=1 Tax=Conidiobolus coronatus (strain ATCC 28846 / CBS 209.66 / NRRL 28638) TaxID=796925 RepID=A0A137PAB6_CONC2|nr:hypothetical protein CONCODRAFT_5273 [Conidiobolus coronatus NRRL 28638]|eukprot:KXN71948.1 hypothetical protein CONCODRAFT_5273 [Conidiobolus coronatus NRRL 28638]
MKLQILLVASTISAYPLNFSDSSAHIDNINETLLAVEDNNIHFIRRDNYPIKYIGQGIGDLGTNIIGGITGGKLTNDYRDTGLVPDEYFRASHGGSAFILKLNHCKKEPKNCGSNCRSWSRTVRQRTSVKRRSIVAASSSLLRITTARSIILLM